MLTTKASGRPVTASGPRAMVKLSSAACSNCDTGFCGWPDRLRGASASSASRIADMAMAAGASTVEVPASGGNGGTATSCGRPSCSEDGQSRFISSVAPMKAATTMAMPRMMMRRFMRPCRLVIRGLDPHIHADRRLGGASCSPRIVTAAWIAGSSPAMTNYEAEKWVRSFRHASLFGDALRLTRCARRAHVLLKLCG